MRDLWLLRNVLSRQALENLKQQKPQHEQQRKRTTETVMMAIMLSSVSDSADWSHFQEIMML